MMQKRGIDHSIMTHPARPELTDREPLAEWALACREQARQAGHRHLICLAGAEAWCIDRAEHLVQTLKEPASLWIGRKGDLACAALDNSRALTRLGSESALLVYNSYSGFDPDALGALSGTLRGGGLLLLLTPPLADWPEYPDPQLQRIAVAGHELPASSRFLTRLARLLDQDPSITIATPEGLRHGRLPTPEARTIPFDDPYCRTADQARAVEAIRHVAAGHRKRPLVLTADRGRGKSSALGIAAAQLIAEGYPRIQICAPSRQAVSSLYDQIDRCQSNTAQSGLTHESLRDALEFVAPDVLLARTRHAELLLVDEAAAIPTPMLQALLEKFPRIVFATTVHGYEGTGMGFSQRFKKHLDRVRPQWRELVLREPIRWQHNDPLEHTVFRLLALDAEPADAPEPARAEAMQLQIAQPDQAWLLESETDLRQLFGLLILAHYRTTPLDLRHLLDGPNLQILLLRQRRLILGVALLASEGGFSQSLARDVWCGARRPRGHLLAQSLTAHLGLQHAATLRGLRIMRIAVHPALQGRGLGGTLLQAVDTLARDQGCAYLGVSCGATPELIRFWRHNRYLPVRLGIRSGASSSLPSVLFLRGLNDQGSILEASARERFARQLPSLLGEPLDGLPAEWIDGLFPGIPFPGPETLSRQDWLDLIAFGFAQRGYEITQAPLEQLVLWGLAQRQFDRQERQFLIMRVLQKHSVQSCATGWNLPGRKGVESRLRQILRPILKKHCDEVIAEQIEDLEGIQGPG
ncbi:MAG: GNAT family N-acetyltransferase [Candidatus Thiodiazotropha sp.]